MRRPWRRWLLTTLVMLVIVAATMVGVYASYRAGATGG
jgi:hypothetical protein